MVSVMDLPNRSVRHGGGPMTSLLPSGAFPSFYRGVGYQFEEYLQRAAVVSGRKRSWASCPDAFARIPE
jgi:hypothetical protein